ncbi:MFS transporter [Chloroflexota bacterium]
MIKNSKPKFFYGYIVVAACSLCMMLMWGISYSFGVFFKPLLAEFGWTRATTSSAYSLCMLLTGSLSIIAGRLTDRFGPRVVITGCGILLGAGCILVSQVNAIWQLYLYYGVLMGAGLSGAVGPMMATVARWFVKRRGMMTGITVSGLGMGTLVTPPVANWLISSYGWRMSYLIVGITILVTVTLVAQLVKRDPGQMGLLPYGSSEVKMNASSLTPDGFSFRRAIKTRQLWLLCIASLFFGFSLQIMAVHIVPYATDQGISAASAAILLSLIGGLGTLGRIILGMCGDRIGNKLAYIVSFSLVSAALFWLLFSGELWMLYLFAIVFGFGYGGIASLVSPVTAEQFGLNSIGIILGVLLFSCALGETTGPVVAGYIFDTSGSYMLAFLICAVLSSLGLVLILLLKRVDSKKYAVSGD